MDQEQLKALILAGGRTWDGSPTALLTVGGKTLLEITCAAFSEVPEVATVGVVGSAQVISQVPEHFVAIRGTGSLWGNICAGAEALALMPDQFLLLSAVDMPFLTAEAVSRFIHLAKGGTKDIVYLAVPVEAVRGFMGHSKVQRTCLRLREGIFTGGNVFLIRGKSLRVIDSIAPKILAGRKSLIRLTLLAGAPLIFRHLIGLLTLRDLEKRAEELTGLSCSVVVADLPELAFDIDKPEHFKLALNKLCG